ncbi:phytanoyl-CoA dioxygenase family protein [Novosphingobium sp. ERN07]|uniref:phytanoyl-CoA dioxygenase family protein n=1 Tax=Novosphingobium sp. ERN07 TaxID=2726187 RepID=UPI0014573EF9|nr:phytanoyl-CoA dioxygenase family protein [Novosphingobium sp. ERN07]NLR73406.1 phytanoyl-CoA dioxygenase family protein [Novosphingobium sp. ERN07]
MAVLSLEMPDAPDLDIETVKVSRELESANHLLGNRDALMRFHDSQGYLLFRDVLDPEALAKARAAMFAVIERYGVIVPGADEPVWAGKAFPPGMEESPEFAGIARQLVDHPANMQLMENILGEPAAMVPIVQYRIYPPGGPVTGVHQDGFFTPGVMNYKPVWMPIVDIDRSMGGLMVAVGQNHRGYFHNLAKAPRCPIPDGVIDPDSWATTDYRAGDVLVIHPAAPHASRPNLSNRVRVSIDTRIQSAHDPRVLLGTVTGWTADSIALATEHGERRFTVDDSTFIRILHPGTRIPTVDFAASVQMGMPLTVVFDGDHAETLRKASDN